MIFQQSLLYFIQKLHGSEEEECTTLYFTKQLYMSSGIDIEFVRKTYQKKTDEEVIRILTQDAVGLTPEAIEVVKEEIKRRNLDPNIIRGIDAQQRTYTIEEIDEYCALIQNLPCPKTGSTSEKLNATLTAEVMSFVLFTNYQKKIVVGTPVTLNKANNAALTTSILLGWWGFPWGIIRTVQAIIINLKNKKGNRNGEPNNYLRSYILSKIGEIETYKENKEKLLQIISRN